MAKHFGDDLQGRLVQLRTNNGYNSGASLAKAIGINTTTYNRIENGTTETISSDILIKLAKLYGVTTDFILGLSDVPEKTYYEISELGLSVEAAENLYKHKAHAAAVNELLLNDKFLILTHTMAVYFGGQQEQLLKSHNKLLKLGSQMINKYLVQGDIPNDADVKDLRRDLKDSQITTDYKMEEMKATFEASINEIKDKVQKEIAENVPNYNNPTLDDKIFKAIQDRVMKKTNGRRFNDAQMATIISNAVIITLQEDANMSEEDLNIYGPMITDLFKAVALNGKSGK